MKIDETIILLEWKEGGLSLRFQSLADDTDSQVDKTLSYQESNSHSYYPFIKNKYKQ